MKKPLASINNTLSDSHCIEEMDALLNQIADFRQLVKSTIDSSDPAFVQEYRLFKQYVEWKSEDMAKSSFIKSPPGRRPHNY